MKKLFLISILAVNVEFNYAQSTGISNDGQPPNNSAMLDVRNPNKGLLVPRVALTGTSDITTIPSAATSLLVYNSATTGGVTAVSPGFYYWNGAAWARLLASGSSWSLTGNAGTDTSLNFLGTTDNKGLQFRINNIRSGYVGVATDGSVFLGSQAGLKNIGNGNVGLGIRALFSNTSASNLVAVGDSTLYNNNTGFLNSAFGSKALFSNTSGNYNAANGCQALINNSSGSQNVANGVQALYFNTSGTQNTANGVQALSSNIDGFRNTGTGGFSLFSNTSGLFNTATGLQALYSNTLGSFNTADGDSSLYLNKTGTYNSALGYGASVSFDSLTNATAIGALAIVNTNNKIRLGNSSVTTIEGQVAYTFPSDARFKYNIKNNVPGLDFIKRLTPVTYYFDEKKLDEFTKTGIISNSINLPVTYQVKQLHTGFLAQDVEKVAQQLGYSFDGVHAPANDKDHYSLAYSQFIMPLVKSVQEQQQIIEELKLKVENQEQLIRKINERIEKLDN